MAISMGQCETVMFHNNSEAHLFYNIKI